MPRGMQGSGERRTCMTAVAQAATAKASQSQEAHSNGEDLGDLLADRVAAIPANPFAKADARVAAAVANGKPVINLAKGNPDGEPPQFMQDAVAKAARESINFKYSPFDGKPEYLAAISSWYRSQHGVHIDPKTQLLAVAGASVGISVAIQALINKDDLVVLVGPYYPQYTGSCLISTPCRAPYGTRRSCSSSTIPTTPPALWRHLNSSPTPCAWPTNIIS